VTSISLFRILWVAAACLIWLRLLQLQVLDGPYWKERGEQIRVWSEPLPARRGRILDREGHPLADNQPWIGQQPMTPELQARMAEKMEMNPNATGQAVRAQRVYPEGAVCGHLTGYAGELHQGQGDWKGREGLELALESRLRGKDGRRQWLVTAQGKRLRLLEEKLPIAGEDVSLTLHLELQRRSYRYLSSVLGQLGAVRTRKDQPAGALVVVDPQSGEVLSLVSLPSYDPNFFVDPRRQKQLQRLLKDPDSPLLNRAIAGQYPAASTFKIVTASAALEEGLITAQRRFYCQGVRFVGETPFHCFVRRGHGDLSFEDSIAYSCDCVFYDLGLELGGKRLNLWAQRWGLGQLTGLELPGESEGFVPAGNLTLGEEANLSIGQGSLLVTPAQMARLVGGVATGGSLAPLSLLPSRSRLRPLRVNLQPNSWKRLKDGLEGAVSRGTAAGVAQKSGLRLAGKTGTVENSPSDSNPRGYNHTWFVTYGPLDSPRPLAIAVFLERSGGYGGALAAPIAAQIAADWRSLEEKSRRR